MYKYLYSVDKSREWSFSIENGLIIMLLSFVDKFYDQKKCNACKSYHVGVFTALFFVLVTMETLNNNLFSLKLK